MIDDTFSRPSRRRALALGAAAVTLASPYVARAQAKSIVLSGWGGRTAEDWARAYAKPFEAATGIKVEIDTSGPSAGKIRAMVESGKVTWDVCDATAAASIELGEAGLLEEIDYSVVPKTMTLPQFAYRWGIGSYGYSSVIAYNTERFKNNAPKSWADFWNVKDFPGRRLLRGDVPAMIEAALMADGVEPGKVYPLDVKRGLDKIRQIKTNCLFWKTSSEAAQLLRTQEVVMANMWNTTIAPLQRDTNGRFAFSWNQGILQPAAWVIPKGNPAGRQTALQLIKFMQGPEHAVAASISGFSGPLNPEAAAAVPNEVRAMIPTVAENVAKQISMDVEWYARNYTKILPQYLELISS